MYFIIIIIAIKIVNNYKFSNFWGVSLSMLISYLRTKSINNVGFDHYGVGQ